MITETPTRAETHGPARNQGPQTSPRADAATRPASRMAGRTPILAIRAGREADGAETLLPSALHACRANDIRAPSRLQRVVYTLRTEGGTRAGSVGDRPRPRRRVLAVHRPAPRHVHRLRLAVRAESPQALPRRQPRQSADHARGPLRRGPAGLVAATGDTYALSLDAFTSMDPWHFGLDLLLGMVLSIVGGLVAGGLTYAALGRHRDYAPHGGGSGSLSRHVADRLGVRARQAARRSRLSCGAGERLAAGLGRAGRCRVRAGIAARCSHGRGRPRRAVATTDGRCRRPDCASTASSCVPVPPIRPLRAG